MFNKCTDQYDNEPIEAANEPAIEDQAEQKANRQRELEKRSQTIQRALPRHTEVNAKMLRPQSEKQNLTELQVADKLIKHEMITMLLYESVKDPVTGQPKVENNQQRYLMESSTLLNDTYTKSEKWLTDEEKKLLAEQNKRMVPEFKARQLEAQAQRNWDMFYKRNETRFFKDRHWITREFAELLQTEEDISPSDKKDIGISRRTLLEVGCGVGNLIYPLIEEQGPASNYFYYACDFSPRAVEFVRSHPLYDESRVCTFQCDITTEEVHAHIPPASLDIVTMVFVLSAIHPNKCSIVLQNVLRLLRPGGILLFRDYGRYDMAQLRFKPGHKIAENLYMRQDGTRSYYFDERELTKLFEDNGFMVLRNSYVHRRTLNIKKGVSLPRIFLQGKFRKKFRSAEQ